MKSMARTVFPETGGEMPDSQALADAGQEAQNVGTVTVSDANDGAGGGGNKRGMDVRLSAMERMLTELAPDRRGKGPERVEQTEPREGRARASESRRLVQAFGRVKRADPLIAESVERRSREEVALPARRSPTGGTSAREVAGTPAPANANDPLMQLPWLKELRGEKRGKEEGTSSSGENDLSGTRALKASLKDPPPAGKGGRRGGRGRPKPKE